MQRPRRSHEAPVPGKKVSLRGRSASVLSSETVEEAKPALPPDSIVTAVTVEQPLPLLVAGLSAWEIGITAAVMIPLGLVAMVASPAIIAYNALWRTR